MFYQISPLTYRISVEKGIVFRNIRDFLSEQTFAHAKQAARLPVVVYRHSSLIRRKLGNVDMQLQENKAVNLAIAAPKISGIIIRPGETFSFWKLVGRDDAAHGFKEGLTISGGKPSKGVGGGMCQFTNLIHWMVLHSELTIVEHHHHNQLDLFPDYKRVIPFGTGTSIFYNYLDYRVCNHSQTTYQFITWTDEKYLHGELRADKPTVHTFHIHAEGEFFSKEADGVYRNGKVYRDTIDKKTGNTIVSELLLSNHAKVMYDTTNIKCVDFDEINNI